MLNTRNTDMELPISPVHCDKVEKKINVVCFVNKSNSNLQLNRFTFSF